MRERLTAAEEVLSAAVGRGAEADLGRDFNPCELDDARAIPDSRVVRAHILERLLRDDELPHGSAVRLTGARITGSLRLEYGRLSRPLRLDLCWFDDTVALIELTTAGIEFVRCRIPAIRADAVTVQGALTARESVVGGVALQDSKVMRSASFEDSRLAAATAPFRARNLEVGGSLLLSRARIFAQDGDAVQTEGLRVASGLSLEGGRFRGCVVLPGARVGGRVHATGAVFRNGDQTAFQAQHLHARGVSLQQCQVTGAIDLRHAVIDGSVSCNGAVVSNTAGQALFAGDITADRIHIEGGARMYGRVSLQRADIRGAVTMRGIVIRNAGGQGIRASGAKVGALVVSNGDIEGRAICDELTATSIDISNARISNPGDISSVVFQSATVRRDLDGTGLTCLGALNVKDVSVAGGVLLDGVHIDSGTKVALAASKCVVGERFSIDGDARVCGDIDLAHADIGKSVALDSATVLGTVRLFQARVRSDVLLRGTYIEATNYGVDAIGLQVDGRFTGRGMVCDGAVRLTAVLADSLVLSGAQIHNPGGNALIASRVEVGSNLVLGEDPHTGDPAAMRAFGGVVLRDSRVGGDVIVDAAELSHPGRQAVDATSIEVGGKLSFERISVDGTVSLDKSQVRRRIVFDRAIFRGFGVGSSDGMVALSTLQANTDELLVDGCDVTGALRLTGSSVSVGVSIRHTTISAPGGVAVVAADLACGEVHLKDLDVTGAIVLSGSKIDGDLLIERGNYRHPGRRAFDVSRASIAGAFSVADATLLGALVMHRAEVGLEINLTSTEITVGADRGDDRRGEASQAIGAAGVRVEGSVECRGLRVDGQVSFAESVITGRLLFRHGSALTASRRSALYAPGLRVLGSVEFGWERAEEPVDLSVTGDIRMDRAVLGEVKFYHMALGAGDLREEGVRPRITLREAQVDRRLAMDALNFTDGRGAEIDLSKVRAGSIELPQGDVAIDLRDAEVRTLELDPSDTTTVLLSGLTFDDPGSADVSTALEWFRRDPTGYQHQAYEQLAAHYRRQGDEAAARTVLLARQRHRRDLLSVKNPGHLMMKMWGYLQDATVGYGYRPGLAAIWFLGLLAIGTGYFWVETELWHETIKPVETNVHPTFNAFAYTLDLLIPLISMGHDLAWDPVGADLVVAFSLIFGGGVLATTIAAAVTRVLARR